MIDNKCERNIYDNAFEAIRKIKSYQLACEAIGICNSDEKSPYGTLLSLQNSNLVDIIGNSMGFCKTKIKKDPKEYPVGLKYFIIWYNANEDYEWSIMDDDLISFVSSAIEDDELKNKMWDALVNQSVSSKEWINNYSAKKSSSFFKIG